MNCESKYKQANIWGQTSKQGELCTMVSKIGARALVGSFGRKRRQDDDHYHCGDQHNNS